MNESARQRNWTSVRTGKTYSVDAGLEDTWLEALNAFEHLYLRSICEGHVDGTSFGSRKSMPILRLSVVAHSSSRLKRDDSLGEQIDALFVASPLSATAKLYHGWSDLVPNDYAIDLDAKEERQSEQMEAWVRDWFLQVIAFLQRLDSLVGSSMGDASHPKV